MEEQSRQVETQAPLLDGELHLLLGDFKDDSTGYRRREATWISIVVHGAIILALIFMPKWLPSAFLIVPTHLKDNNTTMIVLPEDQLKVKPRRTDIVSDQDRTAQTRTPQVDKETLRKLLDARRPGQPQPPTPPPQPAQQAMQAAQAPPQQGQQTPPPPQTNTQAQLQAPQPKQNPFALKSPGSSVTQAIEDAANNPHSVPVPPRGGERGSGFRPKVDARGAMDILSDTMGVDFGAYMKRLHVTVEDHWFPLIPEVALPPMMKRGRVIIEFAIMKDGSIQGLTVVGSSGDTALDRAAYGALLNSVPLPRLPPEFTGPFLKIRAAFYYNPDKNDFE